MTKATFINHKRSIKHCGLIFGEEALSTINSKPRQQAILDALGNVTLEHKQCACAGLCLLLKWLKDSGRLGQAAVNCFRVRVTAKAVPEVIDYNPTARISGCGLENQVGRHGRGASLLWREAVV